MSPPPSWHTWVKSTSATRVIVGAIAGWAGTVFIGSWLVLVPRFDERSRTTLSGTVDSVEIIEFQRAKPDLEFTIASEASRFRIDSGVFRDVFQSRPPDALRVGATCTAIVPTEVYRDPFMPPPNQSPTVYVDALAVSGRDVLTLTQSRAWQERNRRIAMYLAPLVLFLAAALTALAILQVRVSRFASNAKRR
jgi:hypothetical protein